MFNGTNEIARITNEIARIPFHGSYIHTTLDQDGQPAVVLKPTLKAMGLDWEPQRKKLARRSWGVTSQREATGADGKTYEMVTCNLDTWSMLLANIDENKVNEPARPLVIVYQRESAQALRRYWTEGGAINPRATREQLDAIVESVERRIRMIGAAKGLVDDQWLEALTREQLAIGLGREPDQDPSTRLLTVAEYLEGQALAAAEIRKLSPTFGKRLKLAYITRRGEPPGKSLRFVDGAQREVFVYTEADRDLFDAVWAAFNDDLVST